MNAMAILVNKGMSQVWLTLSHGNSPAYKLMTLRLRRLLPALGTKTDHSRYFLKNHQEFYAPCNWQIIV